ncbi:hypothetical protein QBZ16_004012 [Prototheca wickerhamii]|uniref:Uncharacterized protein n=1 Tax=Prototheca wickerhamii TaxID=3111 RepID=A0AAD9IJ78_PROWI|nr:hypothetical protein QBZ16_004012 [Prototheca wickerhamii]
MRTRSGRREAEENVPEASPVEEDEPAQPAAAGDSDDEAPEEVGFTASKKSAAEARSRERIAKKTALEEQKRQRQRRAGKAADEAPSTSGASGEGAEAGAQAEAAAADEADLDLLPEDVLEDVAQNSELNPRREFERRLISEQLREKRKSSKRVLQFSADEPVLGKKKKARHVGPVRVQVLDDVRTGQLPATAKKFLMRRQSKVQRSREMLVPVAHYGII